MQWVYVIFNLFVYDMKPVVYLYISIWMDLDNSN